MLNLCVAYLIVGIFGSVYCKVDIRKPPTITRQSNSTIIYRSESAVDLVCVAEGVPAVTYEWKKNGHVLNLNLPNINKGADGSIRIRPAISSDEGFYQCFARNQFGTALSMTTHAQRAYHGGSSGTLGTSQKTIQAGRPLLIQADPSKSFPKPTFNWEVAADTVDKNPVGLHPTARIQIAENGDLHFAYARLEDALNGRIYKCTSFNPYLDLKAGSGYTKLTVTGSEADITSIPPTVGFASEPLTVAVIGGRVTLRCFFYGNPEPAITWSGPRNTLPTGRYTTNPFSTELTINPILATDEGNYSCTGSNAQGRASHTIQIRVEEVPRFLDAKDRPRDVNVTEGESFTFHCKPEAKPEAKIVWLQDGSVIDIDNPPARFSFSQDRKSLTIRDVCRDCTDRQTKQTDLTVIQCNASNIHGYAFASGYLNVLRKTRVSIRNETDVKVNIDKEGRVVLVCNATSDPSTPPRIRWIRVTDKGEDENVHDEPPFVTVSDGRLLIRVDGNATKQRWGKYLRRYKCRADTDHDTVEVAQNITQAVYSTPPPPPPPPGKTVLTIYNVSEVTFKTNTEGQVNFVCRATPDLLSTYQTFHNEPPFLTVNHEGLFSIHVAANVTEKWSKYLGQYRCVVETALGKINETATISAFVDEPKASEFNWIWICIGIGFLLLLVGIYCTISRRTRSTRAEDYKVVELASREVDAPVTESPYLLYDTTNDHAIAGSENEQGVRGGRRQGDRTNTRTGRIDAQESGRSTLVNSATQTEYTEMMECRCGRSGSMPDKLQSRSNYMQLKDRDLAEPPVYADLDGCGLGLDLAY